MPSLWNILCLDWNIGPSNVTMWINIGPLASVSPLDPFSMVLGGPSRFPVFDYTWAPGFEQEAVRLLSTSVALAQHACFPSISAHWWISLQANARVWSIEAIKWHPERHCSLSLFRMIGCNYTLYTGLIPQLFLCWSFLVAVIWLPPTRRDKKAVSEILEQ